MATLIFPLSRIEGHARVVIEVRDGKVVSAHFQAMEVRGFEHFVKGSPAGEMPVLVPRICGVCSTAHHLAAVKALEDAYGVVPPPAAEMARELLMLGQLIQNQATSLFIFTIPDRLGLRGILSHAADEATEQIRARVAGQALQLRQIGTDLITLAGGQFIHPVKAMVGGMTGALDREGAAAMHARVMAALPVACGLFDFYREQSAALRDRIGSWGDDAPACYLAAITPDRPNYCGDMLRVMDESGSICAVFPAKEMTAYLTSRETDYSYADCTDYQGRVIRANSLARINMCGSMGTPLAEKYLMDFRNDFGRPAHAILLFDLARGIELVYGLERAAEILAAPDAGDDTAVPYSTRDGEGYGLVEAPRGPLVHHYVIEKGLIARAEFIIPSVHNVLAIERALRVAAEGYINVKNIDLELERAVGRVVRAFDPCIACATH